MSVMNRAIVATRANTSEGPMHPICANQNFIDNAALTENAGMPLFSESNPSMVFIMIASKR